MNRLAHLADRPALERELRCIDDCFVPVVQRAQAKRTVELQRRLRHAENRDPPTTRMRKLDETADKLAMCICGSDRIARNDCYAPRNAVGEERRLIVGE